MQPNNNRPVYIVQPSNITHLNVRPTIITTGSQQLQTQPQQPVYQISTIRQPAIPQQTSSLYQMQGQPRLVSSPPVYTSLPTQRFTTPSQTILTANTNISPRLITPSSAPRVPMVTSQPTNTILRPALAKVSTPPMSTSAPTPTPTSTSTSTPATSSQPAAAGSKEFSVRISKSRAQYGIMEFATGLSIDVKDWKAIEMRREINPYTYRPATNIDSTASSTSITTSLGVVLPKTGAGSEYGREQKEALKRKRYATKGTNMEDLPWILTDRSSTEKKLKHYRGMKKGGVTTNSSYYVFIQGKDGFEAYPVEDWYAFTPTNVYKTLDFDEAEKQYQQRHKNLSKWFLKHKVANDKTNEDDIEDGKGKKSTNKTKRDFKLLDAEDWMNEKDDEEDDDNDDQDEDNDGNKKSKNNKKNTQKPKDAWTLSDDDEDEITPPTAKKVKTTKRQTSEDQGEDSDDGDHEGDEIEYTSDETSSEEDDIKDANTDKTSTKYEAKGIDEEIKKAPDIEKRLEQMDENGEDFDFDDEDDEDIPNIDDNDDENGKNPADDLSDVSKLLKSDAVSKEMESSSDDDDLDDSDDPDKEPIEPIASSINTQPIPSEQIKTEKGHKKAKEEEMRAIKSKVMSLPSTPLNPSETITEDRVRSLLLRKQYMTSSELIQHFLPKNDDLRTKEIKEGIVQRLATILKRLNIEEKIINNKKHIKLKST